MWGKNKKINELIKEINQQQEIDLEDLNYIQQSYITREDNILHLRIYLMQIIENGFGLRGGSASGNQNLNAANQNTLNELRQIIYSLQSLEKYRADYEDQVIAKYQNFLASKSNTNSNAGIKALGFKIFSKIHKLNVAYLNKIQVFFPKLYDIIFQDQLSLNSTMKESATQLISKSGLTLGKIFALVAKSGRQRLQKELTKLQNYSSYYSQLAQERSKNNKNERFYSDKYLQGFESFSYIISLQKKFYLRQQPPYKTLLTSKKKEKANSNVSFAGGIGGPNMYDDIMNIDKKSKNEIGGGNGAVGSSQSLHFQKEYESIFEIILSNYEKYMKDYVSNNKYISFKIRAYTQSVVKLKPINKRNPLYNRINHQNYQKEQENRQKIIQQNQSLDNISQVQNNQQQIQRTNAASTSNLDRLMPPTYDFNQRNNQIKNSPSKSVQRTFQSITLNPVSMDSSQFNNFRKRNIDSSQSNYNQSQGGQYQQQSYQMQNYSNTNTNQQTAAKKFQMPTAPIFLSNTLNINNNNNNNKYSSHSNRDISEDCSSQLNQNEEVLSNNGLPSYTEIAIGNDQQNLNNNTKSYYDNQKEKEDFIRPLSYQIKAPSERYKLRQESPQLVQNLLEQQQNQQPYLRRESEDRILNQRRLSKKNIDYQGSLDTIDQASSILQNTLQLAQGQRKSMNNILQITTQSVLNITQDVNKQIPSIPSIAAAVNDDSTKNSQNALADIQQIASEPKMTGYPMSSQIPPTHFTSLTSLDFAPQQKDFFLVSSTQAASLQQQTQGNEQPYSILQNYRSQFPMAGNILLKKNKNPNNIEELQQMQRLLNGVNQQIGQQQQQQIQQQQQQIANNLNSNNNLNITGTNSSITMNNSNTFATPSTAVSQQRLMQQYQQQQQSAKRAAALLNQNMPPIQNVVNFPVQNMLLTNNGFSSTKSSTRQSQQMQFGMQSFPESNMLIRQSLNLPLQQQQQQQQQVSQANQDDQNSILNSNAMKINPRQSRTNQLLIQSQQFSTMVQNNILTHQLQMQQLQRDSLQQKYIQQQQQQQILIQQQQQGLNPAAFFQSPTSNNSMQLGSLTQQPLQKKQFGQSQFGLVGNSQQSPSQLFMPQLSGAQPNQNQQQYSLSQHNLFQTQSLQQLPSNNSNQILQYPNTNQQQGYIQAMNSNANQLAQAQSILNLQNIMSQKYISQEINFKKLRGSLSNNPKQLSSNLLTQNNFNESSTKGSRHRKKYLGNAYHLNGTSNLTNGNGLLGEITKITEENTGSNILEKRDINSASSVYRKQNEGLDIKPNTTRNHLNLKLSTIQNELEDKNQTEQETDMYSKTYTAMKNFVISPPRKVIASKGSKRQNNDGESNEGFQNNPILMKKPSLSSVSMAPVSLSLQQS
ncbi:hypothetical protein TTHERM_00558090 (macronuclear) [Tetrahymena thermophila SB210]|uniref:Uncharacterized protein n=1 Tax=Tetrahymena thermophila (strain SB210) TaxID=312017 RepID=I7M346_TETTS|nr:hypothetical protein TTHERM_00558090 [Tetrahymena thermophila SB210]EAS02128.2 hypothetical protein TTHERM_00558090 [Tetrahymena thermophila SB210]|eukprot:XP_001022373.2 hypothetical protein TTHERM_00558090 [Tetrahymena thermophila SB210]